MQKEEMLELAELIATSVVNALKKEKLVGAATNEPVVKEKTAYQKTEQLLYNYRGFQKIVRDRYAEINNLRKYGVPKRSKSIVEYGGGSGLVQGLVLEEETVEDAVRTVERSVQGTVQAITLIDKCMAALKTDPYYKILEMRYFDGRTQEDIGLHFRCDQGTVSRQKARLVKELSMLLFPDQVMKEFMN